MMIVEVAADPAAVKATRGCYHATTVIGADPGLARGGDGCRDRQRASRPATGRPRSAGQVRPEADRADPVLESEAEVHAKADAVRHLSRELKDSIARQRTTFSEKEYQATIKQLNDEINQFKAEMNATNQVINRLPRGRRGYPANNIVADEKVELTYYKTQLQAEITWRTNSMNQLKSKPFDPKARIQADNDVRDHQESLQQGAGAAQARGCGHREVRGTGQGTAGQEMARHARGTGGRQAEAGTVAGVPPRRQDAGADRALVDGHGLGRSLRAPGEGGPEGPAGEGEARTTGAGGSTSPF